MEKKNDISKTALLIIDVQQGLFMKTTPIYQADQLLKNINLLVDKAHKADVPVIYIQHSDNLALKMDSIEWQLHPQLQPQKADEHIYKSHGNSFEETNLAQILDSNNIGTLVITGLVTHGCVRATCLGALKLGYEVTLVSDAHSSYSDKAAQLIEEWHQKLKSQMVQLKMTTEINFE